MQDAFDGLVSRLDTADKRIWAQACYQQNSQTRKQENKDWKKKKKSHNIQGYGTFTRVWYTHNGNIGRRKEQKTYLKQ